MSPARGLGVELDDPRLLVRPVERKRAQIGSGEEEVPEVQGVAGHALDNPLSTRFRKRLSGVRGQQNLGPATYVA